MVANGEIEVKGGRAKAMFVRGHENREFGPGDAEHEAVAAFVAAVNGRSVELRLDIGRDGFADRADGEFTPWQQAVRDAGAKGVSPFLALVTGIAEGDAPGIDPDADPVEEMTWQTLSGPYQSAFGLTVEPVGSRSALREIGEDLENNLILMHGHYAMACQGGETQFAAIRSEEDGLVAIGEIRAVLGQAVAAACRGRFDGDAPAGATAALHDYVAAVNGRRIETNVVAGRSGFLVEGRSAEADQAADAALDIEPTLVPAMRNAPVWDEDDGYDDEDGWDPEDDEDLAADRPAP